MGAHASKQIDSKTLWGGKISPFSTSYGKLMMWFFLVSDALTFSALLIACGYTRHQTLESWPIGEETFNSLPFFLMIEQKIEKVNRLCIFLLYLRNLMKTFV